MDSALSVSDLRTGQSVGYAYVDVNREMWATESHGFLQNLLYTITIGGLLTAAMAFLTGRMARQTHHRSCHSTDPSRPVHCSTQ